MGSLQFLFFLLSTQLSIAADGKLSSEIKTLLRLRDLLESPPAMAGLTTNSTDFCSLPPSPSLAISCSGDHITSLAVVGNNGAAALSPSFSVDSLFTTLSRLPSLTSLSLVSLGIWGHFSPKIDRLTELQVLNLSWNLLSGEIPSAISAMSSLASLVLKGNSLNGTVPDLRPLQALQVLDLSGNLLGPDFPAIGAGVATVNLGKNRFRCTIPAELESFRNLRSFDLRSNRLFGSIPPFLFSLPSIQYLDLAGNQLAGALPANLSCASGLRYVDISDNLLIGALPSSLRVNQSGRVVIDAGNCLADGDPRQQRSSSYCNQVPLAAVLPPATATASKSSSCHLGLIFGIVGGAVGGAILLGLLLFFFVVLRRAKTVPLGEKFAGKTKDSPSIRGTPRTPADSSREMSVAARIGAMCKTAHRVFTMDDIEEATCNFDPSRLVDEGSQGKKYKGWLRDGAEVEIQSVKLNHGVTPQALALYTETISKLRHRHIVSIIGHCVDDGGDHDGGAAVFLVFERVSNGTLRSHLTEWRKREMLKWPQRVAAAIGVARGIQFLHTATVPGIAGNDLTTENILLDETLVSKISNYNLPPPPSPSRSKNDGDEKDDVYRMGMILLEIITGKPAGAPSDIDELKIRLMEAMDDGAKLREAADPAIRGTFADDSLRTVAEVALSCLAEDHKERPSIDDVLWNLQYSVQIQDGWASLDTLSFRST